MKIFNNMLLHNAKTKFSHFLHDIGLRSALAVTLFSVGLVFSLAVPCLCFFLTLIFVITYFIDKFNLIVVYPVDFDSQITNRKCLI